ncbi:MAG: DUF4412 domain-containing protein [Verrucomicrobia bacterium]|nr:DUF4412 domain-containing protein [Verrucomicrobiota bacterium]
MKIHLLPLLLLAPLAVTAASFEGKVAFKITADRGKAQEMSYQIKNDKMRVELAGQKEMGGMILDLGKRQTIMLLDEQRMYMVMEMPDVAAQAAETKAGDVKLEKTGETEKILGYTATKYVATHENKKTDLWLAEGLGTFMSMPSGGPMGGRSQAKSSEQAWERALAGKDLFPLRVVGYDGRNQPNFRMEVTAIEKKSLSDTLFAPPADYQKFDMGGMMQGLMPGGFPGGKRR